VGAPPWRPHASAADSDRKELHEAQSHIVDCRRRGFGDRAIRGRLRRLHEWLLIFLRPYGSTAAAGAATRIATARVAVANTPLGRVVVDSNGRTLYLFEKDKNRRSACSGRCAKFWPPLLTHGKPVARAGAKQSLLGTIRRANGSQQVTYAGHPLYRYAQDRKPGQTRGEGSLLFGAGWDALSPAGKKIESDD
jgi:predicted lipoprotein with Yx(FWY)xxD motif